MRAWRIGLVVAGLALLGLGVFRLLTSLEGSELRTLLVWLLVAVLVADGVIAPATIGVGVLLARVPPRARRYLQGGLLVGAVFTVVALPLIDRQGTQVPAKALLLRDYAANLALLLGLTAAVAATLYAVRVLRERG